MVKVYRMNELDVVVHDTFEEAAEYYDKVLGLFLEYKDETTGEEYDAGSYLVTVSDEGAQETVRVTVEEGIKKGVIQVPSMFVNV